MIAIERDHLPERRFVLVEVVNHGYERFRAGRADREDHWRFDYRTSYAHSVLSVIINFQSLR